MSEENKNYIDVTAAIIRRGEEILIAQRSQDQSSHPGKWEFPGGKVEPGETSEDCLKRELLEELGIQIQVEEPFLVYEHDYNRPDGKKHRFFSFWCEIVEGKPSLKVHAMYTWVQIEDLRNFDFIEADKQLVDLLRQRFEILERLFERHGLAHTDKMDYSEIEALDMQREDLAKREGWTKMFITELREELRTS